MRDHQQTGGQCPGCESADADHFQDCLWHPMQVARRDAERRWISGPTREERIAGYADTLALRATNREQRRAIRGRVRRYEREVRDMSKRRFITNLLRTREGRAALCFGDPPRHLAYVPAHLSPEVLWPTADPVKPERADLIPLTLQDRAALIAAPRPGPLAGIAQSAA